MIKFQDKAMNLLKPFNITSVEIAATASALNIFYTIPLAADSLSIGFLNIILGGYNLAIKTYYETPKLQT